ncbi:MAG: hypothetical protein CL949_12785 [Erythrobacter sp.]|nr:hypothetical protein [Erythrobacter sp.]|tara:strand:+ start:364 stop:972 length:609 start_codon:yes stop_codon:yes gene_type:complete
MTPFEIICAPMQVFIAEVGTAFPTLDDEPGAGWTLLGKNGSRSTTTDGVTVSHTKAFSKVKTDGATGPVKATLDDEELMFRLNILDLSLEAYQQVLNGNTIAETAAGSGTVGFKKIGLSQGPNRTREFALIARGASPYNDALPLQYCVPRCYESGNAEPIFKKGGTGASLRLEMTALEDLSDGVTDDERFGYLIAANAAALA